MRLILKISWRNILRHKGKSLIIGIILFLGAALMTFGNGVILGMDRGLEKNIVNGFLGDIVIVSSKEKSDNILFKMYGESIETITNYKDIKKILDKEKYITGFLPAGKNAAMVINEDEGDPGFGLMLGVDFQAYADFFPDNFKAIEGRLLKKNESGIIIPKDMRENLYDQINVWLVPENTSLLEENLSDDARENKKNLKIKDTAVFMGMSDTGSSTDIRLPVKGIIKYRALNTIWGHFSIMDIESYRKCLGYFSAEDTSAVVSKEKKKLLSLENENLDAMFGNPGFFISNTKSTEVSKINFRRKDKNKNFKNVNIDDGVFNLIFVKLKDGTGIDTGVKLINKALKKTKPGVRAVSWKKASGFIGNMTIIIKGALIAFVTFLFLVAIIIIINTLTMAAIERTSEIGMMRAIGAKKGFISAMFLGETVILSGLFGGIGVIFGIIAVKITPLFNITSTNDLVQLLFGGDIFTPYLSFGDIIFVIIELVIVTLITVIYPVKVAKNITPLDAITRD